MKYGVIACPKCKKIKGVDLSYKTTKCVKCGKKLTINKLKIFYKTNSQNKLTHAIGLLNAKLDGRFDDFEKVVNNFNL